MSRKPARGYFVRGHFVPSGSALDADLIRERKGERDQSKSDRKRASTALQELGAELLGLRAGLLRTLHLPESLTSALEAARRISDFEGRRRQMQYIGRLMRGLDEASVCSIRAALQAQRAPSAADTALLHATEQWRNRLLDAHGAEQALTDWLRRYPASDAQSLRALLRQARKDAQEAPQSPRGATPRHGRAWREIFALLREQLGQDAVSEGYSAETQASQAQNGI